MLAYKHLLISIKHKAQLEMCYFLDWKVKLSYLTGLTVRGLQLINNNADVILPEILG